MWKKTIQWENCANIEDQTVMYLCISHLLLVDCRSCSLSMYGMSMMNDENWVIENGTNVTNSSYAWKETWSIIFNNLNTNRCQSPTKIRWTYKFQKLYLCYVGWNQWLWVQVLLMYTGCMVLQPRTIDMILGFSPCFPSARTCYPWNTGPEPVLSPHTLTL